VKNAEAECRYVRTERRFYGSRLDRKPKSAESESAFDTKGLSLQNAMNKAGFLFSGNAEMEKAKR
jgi:hypothetical protein